MHGTILYFRERNTGPLLKVHVVRCWLLLISSCLLLGLSLSSCIFPESVSTNITGNVTVAGSTALQPLTSQAATLFEKIHPEVHITVQGIGSIKGLQAVTSKKVDIGTSDIYADPALYPDPNLTDHIVCVIPFAMVVNPGVPITSLAAQQIIDIFSTGKYTNWVQLGGPDIPIVPVVRPSSSGTRDTFRKYILGGRDERYKPINTDSSTEVLHRVATTPGAIGYLALSVVNTSVHKVALNGALPTTDAISSGVYTFWSYEHMYTMGADNKTITAYLDFMLSLQVQQLAQKLSYIPISDMKLPSAGVTGIIVGPASLLANTAYEKGVVRRALL